MTVLEFLNKKENMLHQAAYSPRAFAFIVLSTCPSIFVLYLHFSHRHLNNLVFLGYFVEATMILTCNSFVVPMVLLSRRYKKFIAQHPEMNKLDIWMKSDAGVPIELYPTTKEERQALEMKVLSELTLRAIKTNHCFDFRDAVGRIPGDFTDVEGYFTEDINRIADELHKYYLAYWDLMVKGMEINPTGYDDPAHFRASARVRK